MALHSPRTDRKTETTRIGGLQGDPTRSYTGNGFKETSYNFWCKSCLATLHREKEKVKRRFCLFFFGVMGALTDGGGVAKQGDGSRAENYRLADQSLTIQTF